MARCKLFVIVSSQKSPVLKINKVTICVFQVLKRIYDSNIRNYTIYYDKYHHLLFSHMEYVGKCLKLSVNQSINQSMNR